jgi:hypothetical protein
MPVNQFALIGNRAAQNERPQAFGAGGGDQQQVPAFGGFLASAFSAIPELFGAPPSETAEAFRTQHPWLGMASELGGFAVPYLGEEAAIAKIPGLAARVERGAGAIAGGIEKSGLVQGAAESPFWKGASRELLVNTPIEASRLAVSAAAYPQNFDETSADVATQLALTPLIGGVFGKLAAGGTARKAAHYIEGVDAFTSPQQQLRAIESGKAVFGADKDELAQQLENEVLSGNPGYMGSRGKKQKISYIKDIPGESAEQVGHIDGLFRPGKDQRYTKEELSALPEGEQNPIDLQRQYFAENPSAAVGESNKMAPGELADALGQLPEGLNTKRKLAANVEHPRLFTVHTEEGAKRLARNLNTTGLQKAGNTAFIQEGEGGAFAVFHRVQEGTGETFGKGAIQVKKGDKYLIGKMFDPGLLEPDLAGMRDLVTARWAKMKAAFHPGRLENIFSQEDEAFLSAVNTHDYAALAKLRGTREKVNYLADKFGKMKAEAKGLVDDKFNFKDSKSIQDLARRIEQNLKPTSFMQMKDKEFNVLYGAAKNAHALATSTAGRIMNGIEKVAPTGSVLGTVLRVGKRAGVERVSGFHGHQPLSEAIKGVTDKEVTLIKLLNNAGAATPERLAEMVKDGKISQRAADWAETSRAVNNTALDELSPVFAETGSGDLEKLRDNVGIPRTYQGNVFTMIKDANGNKMHPVWGKNGKEVEREAKLVVKEAEARGLGKWKYGTPEKKVFPTEPEAALKDLQKNIANSLARKPEDTDAIAAAMERLTQIKMGAKMDRTPLPMTTRALRAADAFNAPKTTTVAEMLNEQHGHFNQLYNFAAAQHVQNRFGETAKEALKGRNSQLYDTFLKKQQQLLGLESESAQWLNKTLQGVMPSTLGPKPATAIAAAMNQTVFAFTLGLFNSSFAVLNVLSPLQTVAPWIMQMATLPPEAAADLMGHSISVDAKGNAKGLRAYLEPLRVLSSAIKLIGKPTEELREFIERGIDRGIFHPQSIEQYVGANATSRMGLVEAWKTGGMAAFLPKAANFMGEKSEIFSRLVAFNSAYRVGKDILGLEGDQLYRLMERANEVSMFSHHTADRSELFTGPVGGMFGLFKNWQMHFIGNMMQYAGLAVNERNFGPLLWAGGSAVAIGGLGATPLIAMADGIGNWHNDANSSFLWMEKNFGPDAADGAYFGLPAFLGVSLQASSTLPGTDVRNEVNSLFSFALWNRAKLAYQTFDKAADFAAATGQNPLQDPNIRDMAMQALTPRFFARAMSVTEGDYVRSMSTGLPQVRHVSPSGRMLHALGVNVVEIEKMQEESQVLYQHQDEMDRMVRSLGRAYYDAMKNEDTEEATRVVHRAIGLSISLDRVSRSAMGIQKREEGGDILSRYSKQAQMEARPVLQPSEQTESGM